MMSARLGAASYVAWGLLHLVAAFQQFELAATLAPGMVHGKINQGAWDLVFFSLTGIAIAVTLNWNNDRRGYWLNLVLVSAADIGFILFVLIPGYIGVFPGILGPVFWLGGAILTTIGRTGARPFNNPSP